MISPAQGVTSITLPVSVANGGTGAATLSGLLVGNGTSAISAASIPANTAVLTGSNGSALTFGEITENLTIAAAATTTSNIQIPAGAFVLAVSCRVTTVIPTAATFLIGISGTTNKYGSGISTAANTTNIIPLGTASNSTWYATATPFVITPNLTPADNTGRLRIVCHYMTATAPTS